MESIILKQLTHSNYGGLGESWKCSFVHSSRAVLYEFCSLSTGKDGYVILKHVFLFDIILNKETNYAEYINFGR